MLAVRREVADQQKLVLAVRREVAEQKLPHKKRAGVGRTREEPRSAELSISRPGLKLRLPTVGRTASIALAVRLTEL